MRVIVRPTPAQRAARHDRLFQYAVLITIVLLAAILALLV